MIIRVLMLCILTLTAMGCGSGSEESEGQGSAKPFVDQKLSVFVPQETGLTSGLELLTEEWTARTGAVASVVEYAEGTQPDASAGDVVVATISDMNALASRLAVIPEGTPGRGELNWRELLRGMRDRVTKRGSDYRVVPLSCPTLLCYYRKDLLEAAGKQPPETWEEYNRLVMDLDDWANGLTAVEPWAAESRVTMLTARSAAYASPQESLSLFFDLSSGKPRLNSPGFVRAMEEFKSVAPALSDCWSMTLADCRHALLDGKAAIGITAEPAVVGDELQRPDGLQLGFCRLPGANAVYSQSLGEWQTDSLNQPGVIGFDGYVAGVTEAPDQKAVAAAFNLLAAISEEIVGNSTSTIRGLTATWHADVGATLFEPQLTINEATNYAEASIATLRSTHLIVDLPISDSTDFRTAVANVITAEAIAERSAADMLTDIDSVWQSVIDKIGSTEFTNDYRHNIGLRPQR